MRSASSRERYTSKIRGELRQLSPARRLLGLLPVLVVALAVAAALGGVGVASADEPEAAALAADAPGLMPVLRRRVDGIMLLPPI